MGRLSASLLYPALTGKPYDAKLVVSRNRADFPRTLNAKINDLNASDEFTAHAALTLFQPMLDSRIEEIKSAKGYVVPLNVNIGEYDFTAHHFPMTIQMITDDPKSEKTYTCGWEFNRVGRLNLGACVGAKNWTKNDAAFQYLAMNEAQGQELKSRFKAGALAFYFLMEPTGKFQIVTDPKLRYRSDQAFAAINVAGLQEANVLEFIIADKASGDILIAGPMPGAKPAGTKNAPAASTSGTKSGPAGAEPVNANANPLNANPSGPASPPSAGAPADGTVAAGSIQAGMPSDRATYDLDKFLSQVAYAVYSDAQQVADTSASLQKAQKQLDTIENDPLRDALIRAKEVKDARSSIEALGQKLDALQAQNAIKDSVGSEFGARHTSFPVIEAYAATKHIYFDSYQTADAKRVIVFRGTANKDDVLTDLKLGMTPELFAELATRTKAASGMPMVSGVSDLAIKSLSSGQFNADDTGMPEEFKAAEEIVSRLMATGVRPADIVLSGHSLGGGYAQYAGMRKRVAQVVAFNPAPLSGQLQKDALNGLGASPIRMRHYISFVGMNGDDAAGYFDPVSQLTSEYLKQPELNALRVIGEQYVVRVCASTNSPEYQAFQKKAQDFITKKTLGSLDKEGAKTKTVGKVLGGLDGAVNSTDERMNATKAGMEVGQVPGKVFGSTAYCFKHPYLCGGKLALGGLASAFANKDLPKAWLILNAHKMKNLEEAMQQGGTALCSG